MKNKYTYLTIFWGASALIMLGLCILKYYLLPCHLESQFDEGYFIMHSVFGRDVVAFVSPPSLAMSMIHTLIPNIEQCDVLALRHYAFLSRSVAYAFLIISSCIYLYRRFNEKRIHPYLALVASYLLIGQCVLQDMSINWNDAMFILVSVIFSICVLFPVTSNIIVQYLEVILIGIVALITLLSNPIAGSVLLVIIAVYLMLIDWKDLKHCFTILGLGFLGLLLGMVVVHFWLVSIQDIYAFVLDNFLNVTGAVVEDAHSISNVIFAIFFGIRDLLITTLLLCGITYICNAFHKLHKKSWLTFVLLVICFFIAYKWQVKPRIILSSVLCWYIVMSLIYSARAWKKEKNDLIILIFAFILPMAAVCGTNTNILYKSIMCSASYGLLLFLLYYLSTPAIRKYAIYGWLIIACVLVVENKEIYANLTSPDLHFESATPLARMKLNENQKVFYDEVYAELSENGYRAGQDTLLGFCFNQMTIIAMDAVPYINGSQPIEFLRMDWDILPPPNYIIFSEWDSIVLYNRFKDMDWNFPDGYSYYKCVHCANPELKNKLNHTQSMIYCRKE